MSAKTVLFVFGTRPEVIKLAPVIRAFRECTEFATRLCVTAQHRELLDQPLRFFGLQPDCDLALMAPNQSLPSLASKALAGCAEVYDRLKPDLVFVQGDTTTAFCGALAASLCKIPVAHVEAGLRSHRRDSPFPEEINRTLIGHVADLHFAPSPRAAENLAREGLSAGVHVVGNTIVDALAQTLQTLAASEHADFAARFPEASAGRKTVLVTLHRRESFGAPLAAICRALRRLAEAHPDVAFYYPVHPNPNVREYVHETLSSLTNLQLLEPLNYAEFIWLLARSVLVLSDSGGVLEEAETLGLPVLVAREVTERMEAIAVGNARLVGCDEGVIFAAASTLLAATTAPRDPAASLRHTFGDGKSSARILQITREFLATAAGAAIS